jgi:methyltransferase (TIGR00027 family)
MRSDNDSWDITTSVGSTALMVAAARALEAQKPHPVAVDPYGAVFSHAAGGQWADVVDGKAPDHPLNSEWGTHFIDFQGARTAYFDAFFARAAGAGVRQVVMLAAGLDSRAYRLQWADGTVVYELDQPRVLEFKQQVISAHGGVPAARRVEIAVDLRDDWPQALRDHGFDAGQPAAFIAEGLLIYLPATAQEALFRGIDSIAAPGSFVGIEEGAPMPGEVWEAAKTADSIAQDAGNVDQNFFHLIYNEQFAPAAEWFGGHGWQAEPTPLADQLQKLGKPLPEAGSQAAHMVGLNTLVSAIKAGV